jgi:hypothetical protein
MQYINVNINIRYKNPAIKIFFNFLDITFGIFLFSVLIYALKMYYAPENDCLTKAPILYFFQ